MPRWKFNTTIGLVALLVTTKGFAQTEGTPNVVPPTVMTPAAVTYPQTAIAECYFAETEVVLLVDVDKTGAVSKATPESPAGHGFDDVAVAAAMTLRFEPATRDGTPIAARIKYRFLFHPPPAKLIGRVSTPEGRRLAGSVRLMFPDGTTRDVPTDADGQWSVPDLSRGKVTAVVHAEGFKDDSTEVFLENGEETNLVTRLSPVASDTARTTPAEDSVEEVNVHGAKPPREVTKRTLSREEIDKIPGTNGDALRSIQSLPGVARPPPFGGVLIVRGSAPAETTTFVDGTPIPLTYHFGGLSSVVPTETLERIDFYPGNYGVTYGRGTAGMVDVALRDPKKDFHGFAQLDLIDLRLLVEGPIGKTGWKFLAAGRRSWFDTWLVPILEGSSAAVGTAPRYYDYQLMLQGNLGKRASLRLTFFGSDDALSFGQAKAESATASIGGTIDNKTKFYRLQAIYDHRYSDSGELRAVAAIGRDKVDIGVGTLFASTSEYPFSLRTEVSQRLASSVRAHLGVDFMYAPYDLSLRLPPKFQAGDGPPAPGSPPILSNTTGARTFAGGYGELEVVPWRGGRIVPGFRVDYTSVTKSWDVSPRINFRQDLTQGVPRTTLKGGVGLFYQPPSIRETDPNYGQTGLKSNRAVHYALGFEQQFTEHLDLSVEVFGKTLDRLVVSGSGNSGEGRAYGAEFMLRFKGHPRFFGWLAYTYSRSERRDTDHDPWHLFQYDQTHNLTVVGSYDLGKGFRVGGRFRLVSGNLYTPNIGGGFDASSGSYADGLQEPEYGSRLPIFHQLDLRLDKTWTFPNWKLTAYADVQNVYNYLAKEGMRYNFDFTVSGYNEGLTILPSIGLRGEL
ncbi:TonB family protein [Pendulispora rubella]|uniref:TonB family protein n=1 Tax=Pendulispora rubella TaxID=2741070 RepID=A0ABZ2L5K9_9BACT